MFKNCPLSSDFTVTTDMIDSLALPLAIYTLRHSSSATMEARMDEEAGHYASSSQQIFLTFYGNEYTYFRGRRWFGGTSSIYSAIFKAGELAIGHGHCMMSECVKPPHSRSVYLRIWWLFNLCTIWSTCNCQCFIRKRLKINSVRLITKS